MMNKDRQEILKKMAVLAYQKNNQILWDTVKEVFKLSDDEYLEIRKKAHVWSNSIITSRKNIKENTSKYECINSSKVCDNFESAVHVGLTLLAEKNGFKIQQQDVILKSKAPKSDYKITVKFAKDNTLIITQNDLGQAGRQGEDMIRLSFDWPQASDQTKQMIKNISNAAFFYELLPTLLNELIYYQTRTYFSKRLYRSRFSLLKIYDLDYLGLQDEVMALEHRDARIIQNKYHDWLQNNKDRDLLSHLIENIDKNIESHINFIDHLVINTDPKPSVICSRQLNLTINLLHSNLFSCSTFMTLLKRERLEVKSSWDILIVDSLNSLIQIDPLINDLIITLFIKKPKEGRTAVDKLWSYTKEQKLFSDYEDDRPLYDSYLKGYYINDGTNTISDKR